MLKIKKITAILLSALLLAAGTAACTGANTEETTTESTVSSDTALANSETTETTADTQTSETTEQPQTSKQSSTKATQKVTTKKQSSGGSHDFTVKEVLDALNNYYGDGYDVNGTVSEDDFYYFAVYKKDKKYASVKVNMQNGDAVETLTESGKTAKFNVFV